MVIASENRIDLHSSISEQFLDGTLGDTGWAEAKEKLALPFADVVSHEWFFDGIRIGYADWHFHQQQKVPYETNIKNDVVTLYFNIKGRTSSTYTGSAHKPIEIGNNQHNLFYSPAASGCLESVGRKFTSFMIQFSLPAFLRITHNANDALKRFSEAVLLRKPLALAQHKLFITAEMFQAIHAIIQCPYETSLKRMFYFSKSIELLVMQAEACNAVAGKEPAFVKTEYDKEQIGYAREYLIQNLDNPPSLAELSRICGINEYKLKKGFKETFGNTVFGYLADRRLELARHNLLNGQTTASDIATNLGYSSPQHFSRAFKNKFGISPRQLRTG